MESLLLHFFLYSVTDYVTARVPNPDYIIDLLTVQLFLKHFCFYACIVIVVFCIFSFTFFEYDNSHVLRHVQSVQKYLVFYFGQR